MDCEKAKMMEQITELENQLEDLTGDLIDLVLPKIRRILKDHELVEEMMFIQTRINVLKGRIAMGIKLKSH